MCYSDCVRGSFDVVDADDVRAFQNSGSYCGQSAVQTMFSTSGDAGFVSEDAADEGFARGADQYRIIREGGDELVQLGDEFEVLFLRLAEADTGIDHD